MLQLPEKTLAMLRCPQSRAQVQAADEALVRRLNDAIAAGKLVNRSGHKVERPLDGALLREGGDLAYPIVDQIPVMLYDEAIAIEQLGQQ